MKEAMDLVLDQNLLAEVSARYDVFSIFTVGKKCNTTFSMFDLYLTLKMNFENCELISSSSRGMCTRKISSRSDK